MAADHRRPNDHLVEPLFSGLEGADPRQRGSSKRPLAILAVALVALAAAAVLALTR